ncbi:MAG TPA: HAD family hydrolase [Candidatus Acidoferrales bacterium]|nr:HAD family hydrolase [Candidatus Acidoferrales bacterium]
MIQAVIMDVDGVIVGKKSGINFPLPNVLVIKALRRLNEKGIPVILCTAKFNHAVKEIIIQAELRNPHITDGGALIIDPLNEKIVKKHVFPKDLARTIVEQVLSQNFYTEVYGVNDYYLQKDHIGKFTEKRIKILQKEHTAVDSLLDKIDEIEVIKIINFAHTSEDRLQINKLLDQFSEKIHVIWSHHPATLPAENTVITIKGVSKKDAALEVLDYLKISPSETLGVGDTIADWNFMSLCKYVGVVGDASQELKDLSRTKGEGNYYFSPSVDEDGFLEIVDYFKDK